MFTIARSRTPLADLQVANHFNRLLDEAFRWPALETPVAGAWTPPVDVRDDEHAVTITTELPGVKPEDVRISVENSLLTISGEKRSQAASNGDRAHRHERGWGAFERRFTVPTTVDADRIEARYDLGVLTLTLPKAEKAKPRQIQVKVTA